MAIFFQKNYKNRPRAKGLGRSSQPPAPPQTPLYSIHLSPTTAYLISTAVQSALSIENYKGHFALILSRDAAVCK